MELVNDLMTTFALSGNDVANGVAILFGVFVVVNLAGNLLEGWAD